MTDWWKEDATAAPPAKWWEEDDVAADFSKVKGAVRLAPKKRETTVGEFVGGAGLDLVKGIMRAPKVVPDLMQMLGGESVVGDLGRTGSDFFRRGIEAAEDFQPQAYKDEKATPILQRNTQGDVVGIGAPSAESAMGLLLESIPQLPSMLVGGGIGTKGLQALNLLRGSKALGFGLSNAAHVAPGQYDETLRQAQAEGDPAADPYEQARTAAMLTAALSALTGSAGAGVAGKLGGNSSGIMSALLKGFGADAPFEGSEEAGQYAIDKYARGKDIDPIAALEVGLQAAAGGGAPGAAIAGLEYAGQRPTSDIDPDLLAEGNAGLEPDLAEVLRAAVTPGAAVAPETLATTLAAVVQPTPAPKATSSEDVSSVPPTEPAPPAEPAPSTPLPERTVATTLKDGSEVRLQDAPVDMGDVQDSGGWTREAKAYDADGNEVGSLLYANDGTPPTVEVVESARGKGVATALYALAREQGADLGDAQTGVTEGGSQSRRSEDGQAFREAAKDATVELRPVEAAPTGKLYERGRGRGRTQAVVDEAGVWHERKRDGRTWGDWQRKDKPVDVKLAQYRESSMPGGSVNIPGVGRIPVAKSDTAKPDNYNPLLDLIAGSGGISRADAARMGVDPASLNDRRGIKMLYGNNGIALDALREKMIEEGYFPEENPDEPSQIGVNEVWEMVERALNGEAVGPLGDAGIAERQMARHAAALQEDGVQLEPADIPDAVSLADLLHDAVDAGAPFSELEQTDGESTTDYLARLRALGGTNEHAAQPDQGDSGERSESTAGRVEAQVPRRPAASSPPEAAPGQASVEDAEPTTSTKNEVTDAEREARGAEPIQAPEPQSDEETLAAAREELAANPDLGRETVAKLQNASVNGITVRDEAVLLAEKVRLQTERDAAADRAADESLTTDQRQVARQKWMDAEAEMHQLDLATHAGGTEWGRFGQFRQQQLRQDFTFEALQRKERATRGAPLTPEQVADVKALADKVQALEDQTAKQRELIAEYQAKAGVDYAYAQLQREQGARPRLEALRQSADEARAALAAMQSVPSRRGQSGAAMDPIVFVHLTRIGVYHVANGAVTFGDWVSRMRAELGDFIDDFKDSLREVFKASQAEARKPRATARTKKAPTTPAEALAAVDPQKLAHGAVYRLAAAHAAAGVRGADALMAAVHKDIQTVAPGMTERDVRRLFSDYGRSRFPSKAEDKVALREARAIVQVQESIDRLAEGKPALRSGLQRDKPSQQLRALRRRLNNMLRRAEATQGISPERLAGFQEARASNLRNQIEDMEAELATGVKPDKRPDAPPDNEDVGRLRARRDELKAQLDAIEAVNNPPLTPDQKYQRGRGKGLQREIDKIAERIRNNDYALTPPRIPKVLGARNTKLLYELHRVKQDFQVRQFEIELSKRSPLGKALGAVAQSIHLSRALMTSFDLSATLRQGGFITFGHPIRGAKALFEGVGTITSEKAAFAAESAIQKRPLASVYVRAGLELTNSATYDPKYAEEQFMSRWANAMPWYFGGGLIRGSQRAFVATLNRLRADTFDAMYAGLVKDARNPTEAEIKAIGKYINVATGRGTVRIGTKELTGLNTVFFAPRLVWSRFQLLAAPVSGFHSYGSARTRMLVAQEYGRFLIGVSAAIGLLAYAFDDDEDDKGGLGAIVTAPNSASFLKVKVGDNIYLDPMTGLAQVSVLLARVFSGETTTGKGKVKPLRMQGNRVENELATLQQFGERLGIVDEAPRPAFKPLDFGGDTGADVLFRFLRTKLAPIPGAAVNLIAGENLVGDPSTVTGEVGGLLLPLSFRDIDKVMVDAGVPKGTSITMLNLLGVGMQYRDPDSGYDELKHYSSDPRQ